jgi:Xaa-Pro aminopeptidase
MELAMRRPRTIGVQSKLCISAEEYARRVDAFCKRLAPGSLVVIPAGPQMKDPNDRRVYRQSSDMLYLNGFPEPQSALVITKGIGKAEQRVVLFAQPKDPASEIWQGIRLGLPRARSQFHADEAHPIADFEKVVAELLEHARDVYYRLGSNPELDSRFQKIWSGKGAQKTLRDPSELLHKMRLRKSPQEVAMIRHACDVSAQAHVVAIKATKPGVSERQLQGLLEGTFLLLGTIGAAYAPLVAGGNNGFSLHYAENKDLLVDGELVMVDAACEFDGYMSDITRVWPVNGKFSPVQREIYALVLKAQEASLASVRPGQTLRGAHSVAERVLAAGLRKLGVLRKGLSIENFFPHGTSHWIGLDVHDPCADSWDVPFRSGMVLTVEPGLYFEKNDRRVPAKYRGIHVRIEDTVAVRKNGCEVLTAGVPKSITDIEQLMAQSR